MVEKNRTYETEEKAAFCDRGATSLKMIVFSILFKSVGFWSFFEDHGMYMMEMGKAWNWTSLLAVSKTFRNLIIKNKPTKIPECFSPILGPWHVSSLLIAELYSFFGLKPTGHSRRVRQWTSVYTENFLKNHFSSFFTSPTILCGGKIQADMLEFKLVANTKLQQILHKKCHFLEKRGGLIPKSVCCRDYCLCANFPNQMTHGGSDFSQNGHRPEISSIGSSTIWFCFEAIGRESCEKILRARVDLEDQESRKIPAAQRAKLREQNERGLWLAVDRNITNQDLVSKTTFILTSNKDDALYAELKSCKVQGYFYVHVREKGAKSSSFFLGVRTAADVRACASREMNVKIRPLLYKLALGQNSFETRSSDSKKDSFGVPQVQLRPFKGSQPPFANCAFKPQMRGFEQQKILRRFVLGLKKIFDEAALMDLFISNFMSRSSSVNAKQQIVNVSRRLAQRQLRFYETQDGKDAAQKGFYLHMLDIAEKVVSPFILEQLLIIVYKKKLLPSSFDLDPELAPVTSCVKISQQIRQFIQRRRKYGLGIEESYGEKLYHGFLLCAVILLLSNRQSQDVVWPLLMLQKMNSEETCGDEFRSIFANLDLLGKSMRSVFSPCMRDEMHKFCLRVVRVCCLMAGTWSVLAVEFQDTILTDICAPHKLHVDNLRCRVFQLKTALSLSSTRSKNLYLCTGIQDSGRTTSPHNVLVNFALGNNRYTGGNDSLCCSSPMKKRRTSISKKFFLPKPPLYGGESGNKTGDQIFYKVGSSTLMYSGLGTHFSIMRSMAAAEQPCYTTCRICFLTKQCYATAHALRPFLPCKNICASSASQITKNSSSQEEEEEEEEEKQQHCSCDEGETFASYSHARNLNMRCREVNSLVKYPGQVWSMTHIENLITRHTKKVFCTPPPKQMRDSSSSFAQQEDMLREKFEPQLIAEDLAQEFSSVILDQITNSRFYEHAFCYRRDVRTGNFFKHVDKIRRFANLHGIDLREQGIFARKQAKPLRSEEACGFSSSNSGSSSSSSSSSSRSSSSRSRPKEKILDVGIEDRRMEWEERKVQWLNEDLEDFAGFFFQGNGFQKLEKYSFATTFEFCRESYTKDVGSKLSLAYSCPSLTIHGFMYSSKKRARENICFNLLKHAKNCDKTRSIIGPLLYPNDYAREDLLLSVLQKPNSWNRNHYLDSLMETVKDAISISFCQKSQQGKGEMKVLSTECEEMLQKIISQGFNFLLSLVNNLLVSDLFGFERYSSSRSSGNYSLVCLSLGLSEYALAKKRCTTKSFKFYGHYQQVDIPERLPQDLPAPINLPDLAFLNSTKGLGNYEKTLRRNTWEVIKSETYLGKVQDLDTDIDCKLNSSFLMNKGKEEKAYKPEIEMASTSLTGLIVCSTVDILLLKEVKNEEKSDSSVSFSSSSSSRSSSSEIFDAQVTGGTLYGTEDICRSSSSSSRSQSWEGFAKIREKFGPAPVTTSYAREDLRLLTTQHENYCKLIQTLRLRLKHVLFSFFRDGLKRLKTIFVYRTICASRSSSRGGRYIYTNTKGRLEKYREFLTKILTLL